MRTLLFIFVLMVCVCVFAGNIFSVHEGDSITEGGGLTSTNTYVYLLSTFVNDPHVLFTNRGSSGDMIASNTTASDVLTNLNTSSSYVMTLATMQLGINDVSSGYDAPTIQTNYLTWIGNVRSSYPKTKIIQFTLMPTLGIGFGTARDIVRTNVNQWIRTTSPVDLVVDMVADPRLTPTDTNYFLDGTHPNSLGRWVMASNAFYRMSSSNLFDYRDRPIVSIGALRIGR